MRITSRVGQELLPTLKLAVPMILTQLLGFAQQVIDTVMAGRYSTFILAGVSLAVQLYVVVYVLMIGFGIGLSALISRHHGNNNPLLIRRTFQQGIYLFSCLAGLTAIATFGCAYLPNLIGSAAEIAREARLYLLTLAVPAGVFIFAQSARYFFEGMSHPKTNNLVQAALLPVNIVGNWFFLTHTSLNAQGMAISTGICCLLYAILLFGSLTRRSWNRYRLFTRFNPPDWQILRQIVAVGYPIGLAIVMEVSLFSMIGMIVSRSDAITTGANQVVSNYASLMFMLPLGIGSALTIRIANALGCNDWSAIANRTLVGIGLCAGVMLCSAVVMALFGKYIALLYTENLEVIEIASDIMLIAALFQLFDGIQVGAAGVLRGLCDTRITLLYALIGYWLIGFPAGLLMDYVFGLGIYGLWSGVCIGLFVFAWLAIRRVLRHLRHDFSRETTHA